MYMVSRTRVMKKCQNVQQLAQCFHNPGYFQANVRPYNVIKKKRENENKTMKIVHLSSKVQYFLLLLNTWYLVICTGTQLKSTCVYPGTIVLLRYLIIVAFLCKMTE